MDFKGLWERFFGMVKLEEKAYTDAANKDFTESLLIFAIAAVAMALGGLWITFNVGEFLLSAVGGFIGIIIGYFVFVGILWLLAMLLGGKGRYMEQYVSSSHVALWNVLYVIPVVGQALAALGSLWGIVMTVLVVRNVHKISTGKAVVVVLIPLVIAVVIFFFVAAAILAALGLGALGQL